MSKYKTFGFGAGIGGAALGVLALLSYRANAAAGTLFQLENAATVFGLAAVAVLLIAAGGGSALFDRLRNMQIGRSEGAATKATLSNSVPVAEYTALLQLLRCSSDMAPEQAEVFAEHCRQQAQLLFDKHILMLKS